MNRRHVYRKIMSSIFAYPGAFCLSLVFTLICVLLTLWIPVLVGEAIDGIIGPGQVDFSVVLQKVTAIGFTAVGTAVSQWCSELLNNRLAFRVVGDLRQSAFSRMERLSMSYLDAHSRGDIISRVVSDTETFSDGLILGFRQLFSGVLTILGTLVFMLRINVSVALIVIVVTPLSLFVAKFLSTHTYRHFQTQTEIRGEQTAFLTEDIQQLKTVKAFGREGDQLERFDEINRRFSDASLKATFFSSLTNPSTRFVNSLVYAGVALFGALAVIRHPLTFSVGTLTCFLNYANQYTKPFNEISGVITELQNAIVCAERVFALIDAEPTEQDDPGATELTEVRGDVSFHHVAFSYAPDKPLFTDIDFEVQAGQKIAIVGPTGCGKTSLIGLLMRFYDVDKGAILLDGKDIRSIRRDALRSQIGMVLQDTWVPNRSVRDNIALGRPDASLEEIIAAAKAAHAHSFIKRLPQGYDTVIGETTSLSQGQKQLLCIARVMLHVPKILILDEATSSIDTRTERKIQQGFDRLTKGRTSFIVAHRLSTIQEADAILVMQNGTIVETGSHDQLLKKNGFYAALYRSQFAHEGAVQ